MAQSDLIEGGLRPELRGDVLGLVFVRCAAPEVRVQPHGHEVVSAGNVLNLEDDGPLDAVAHHLIRPEQAQIGRFGMRGLKVEFVGDLV